MFLNGVFSRNDLTNFCDFGILYNDWWNFKKMLFIFLQVWKRLRCRHTVWHEIFAGSDFSDFSSFRKNKFPQIKTTANIFPANIYSKVNIL